MPSGLQKIKPDRRDYSLLHTYGALAPDPKGLPESFSIYDGRPIPNQMAPDTRFTPPLPPMPMGCTGESTTFIGGLEDNALYPPDDFYFNTPPGGDGGRDIRESLKQAKKRGYKLPDGTLGAKKGDYYNCYGKGLIDDFDAARIAIWINQGEKRSVSVGTWWYWGSVNNNIMIQPDGTLNTPSYNTDQAGLHNWIVVGWKGDYLICIPWAGMYYGDKGLVYMSRTIYNNLMKQPWTGAFTLAKNPSNDAPLPIGWQAIIDHLVYFLRNLWGL